MGNKDKGKREKKKQPKPKTAAPKREEFSHPAVHIVKDGIEKT